MPTVVAFTGLPGTGKSTLADLLARAIGAPSIAGDWLLGALAPHGVLNGLDRPAYLALYHDLIERLVLRQLMLGQSAVVDGLVTDAVGSRRAHARRAPAAHQPEPGRRRGSPGEGQPERGHRKGRLRQCGQAPSRR
jgi:predicted kinase